MCIMVRYIRLQLCFRVSGYENMFRRRYLVLTNQSNVIFISAKISCFNPLKYTGNYVYHLF
jgi:hypothetical protein